MITIYHNPRCSKSRQTLALLEDRGLTITIRRYLEDAPDVDELRQVSALVGGAGVMIRRGEDLFKELNLKDAGQDEMIMAMVDHPKLIERPIVRTDKGVAIGRPPENVYSIL